MYSDNVTALGRVRSAEATTDVHEKVGDRQAHLAIHAGAAAWGIYLSEEAPPPNHVVVLSQISFLLQRAHLLGIPSLLCNHLEYLAACHT